MIIELQIRNCTSAKLHFQVMSINEVELDYSTSDDYFAKRDPYRYEMEARGILSWTPKLAHDRITATVAPVALRQNKSGIIPCDTRIILFLDYNNKVKLFCSYRGRRYSTVLTLSRLRNFNVIVGLTGMNGATTFFDCCENSLIVDENSNYELIGMNSRHY